MNAKKRTSLDAVFGSVEPEPATQPKKGKQASEASGNAENHASERAREGEGAAKRPGVKQHTAYLPMHVHEQLRKLAFEENRKIHDYLLEGLDRVFADRGLPGIRAVK